MTSALVGPKADKAQGVCDAYNLTRGKCQKSQTFCGSPILMTLSAVDGEGTRSVAVKDAPRREKGYAYYRQ